ncbi:uncharacterized protein LOC132890101 isoform X2 [Neoarius graeffei]|uniref:uncharacterized protein LOC132890101 isoform X2 n=1 Tax=Neoarius graeffei TaxID=443677 RepID=UPI00298CD90A|nr:uncharacterized protein LOC132890101 isoform X2 [Neoarius graeffei]
MLVQPSTRREPEAAPAPSSSDVGTTRLTSSSSSREHLGLIPAKTLEAEILWCLKLTESHWSYRSSEKSGSLFRRMFPDSNIASSFQCGETKSSYLTVFGLAPYCKSLVMDRIKSAQNGYVLLFDESLNQKTQSKQMDIHVKFWDNDIVATHYFSSDFMGHSTAEDMVKVFHKATEGLTY